MGLLELPGARHFQSGPPSASKQMPPAGKHGVKGVVRKKSLPLLHIKSHLHRSKPKLKKSVETRTKMLAKKMPKKKVLARTSDKQDTGTKAPKKTKKVAEEPRGVGIEDSERRKIVKEENFDDPEEVQQYFGLKPRKGQTRHASPTAVKGHSDSVKVASDPLNTQFELEDGFTQNSDNGTAMNVPRTTAEQYAGSAYKLLDPRDVPGAPRNHDLDYLFSYLIFRGPQEERVKMHYITFLREAESRAQKFLGCKVLGLDLEWKPGGGSRIIDRVSLIQVASESDIALFHIARYKGDAPGDMVPPTLKKILADKDVYKTGSMVKNDAAKLEKHLGCTVQGLVDLKQLLHIVHPGEKGSSATLQLMVKRYFDLPLDKDHTKRCTDWTKMLDMKQKEYAATDAYASLKVFQAIDAERHAKRLPPVRVLLAANTESNASRKRKAVVPACTLTTALRQLRDDLATKHKVSGWHRIMTNAVIADIATVVPTTKVELGAIQSLDRRSFHAYGAEIVDAVKKHADQYQISKRPNLKQGNLKLWTSSTQSSSQGTGSGSQTSYGGSQTGYIGSQPSFSQTTSTTSSMTSCYSSPRSHAAAAEEVLEDIDMNVYDEV